MLPQIKFLNLQLPTFFLVISLSLTLLLFWLSQRLESENGKNFDRKIAFDISLIIMISGFLGARLFHVFYEHWDFYLTYPLEIFKFWNGGFVYFGGFLAALLMSSLYLKSQKQNFLSWADFFTPLLSASYALGRVGCLLEGCCYGQYCTLPWAIAGRHPTQIYMSLGEFFILGLLLLIEKKIKLPFGGYLFTKWIMLHSIFRFVFEFFRDDDRGISIQGLSISQAICIVLFFGSSIFLFRKLAMEKLKTNLSA
jgi:phosphatidylglycerol:prolipoprotein diacylglycerol transferase